MRRLVVAVPAVILVCLSVSCPFVDLWNWLFGGSDTDGPGMKTFEVEVDWQEGMNPFGGFGQSEVRDAFESCAKLAFIEDQTSLPREALEWFRPSLEDYWWMCCVKESPIGAGDSLASYPYYLCGITCFKDRQTGHQIDSLAGGSREVLPHRPKPYETWSFIALDIPGMDNPMVTKSCCHELGHQLAGLTHLCENTPWGWSWDTLAHDDPACLTGQPRVSRCTGEDLTFNIHFCDKCEEWIRRVKQ